MDHKKQYLIVIRGNSGSGKSTLARELQMKMLEKGVNTALVEQDYFRRIVLKEKEIQNGDNIALIEQVVLFALKREYSVVLEGILSLSRYGATLERLNKNCEQRLIYYMDVPFKETLRRHHTKPNAHEFGEKEMREWWREQDLTHFSEEKIISADSTLEQSLQAVLRDLKLN